MQRGISDALYRPVLFVAPFDDAKLRIAMYRALVASSLSSSRTQSSIITFTMQLLARGMQDPEFEISEFCASGIASCSAVLNPRVPLIPTPIADDQRYNPLVPMEGITSGNMEQPHEQEDLQLPPKRAAFANIGSSSFAPPSAIAPSAPAAATIVKPVSQPQQQKAATHAPAPKKKADTPAAPQQPATSRFAAATTSSLDNFDVDNVDIVMDGPDSDDDN